MSTLTVNLSVTGTTYKHANVDKVLVPTKYYELGKPILLMATPVALNKNNEKGNHMFARGIYIGYTEMGHKFRGFPIGTIPKKCTPENEYHFYIKANNYNLDIQYSLYQIKGANF